MTTTDGALNNTSGKKRKNSDEDIAPLPALVRGGHSSNSSSYPYFSPSWWWNSSPLLCNSNFYTQLVRRMNQGCASIGAGEIDVSSSTSTTASSGTSRNHKKDDDDDDEWEDYHGHRDATSRSYSLWRYNKNRRRNYNSTTPSRVTTFEEMSVDASNHHDIRDDNEEDGFVVVDRDLTQRNFMTPPPSSSHANRSDLGNHSINSNTDSIDTAILRMDSTAAGNIGNIHSNSNNNSSTPNWEMVDYERDVLGFDSPKVPSSVRLIGYHSKEHMVLPQILNQEQLDLLRNELPKNLRQHHDWKLVYSTFRDGISLNTLLDRLHGSKHPSIVIIKSITGNIFGGFASKPWEIDIGYHGSGQCFLWKLTGPGKIESYHWTHMNYYFMVASKKHKFIAMGGGDGKFGFWLDDSLKRGNSDRCSTFGNPPLDDTLDFTVSGVETYTIVSSVDY